MLMIGAQLTMFNQFHNHCFILNLKREILACLPQKDQCEVCVRFSVGSLSNEEYTRHQDRKMKRDWRKIKINVNSHMSSQSTFKQYWWPQSPKSAAYTLKLNYKFITWCFTTLLTIKGTVFMERSWRGRFRWRICQHMELLHWKKFFRPLMPEKIPLSLFLQWWLWVSKSELLDE